MKEKKKELIQWTIENILFMDLGILSMANAGENTNGKIYSCVYIVAIAIQTIGMNLSYHFCS